VSPITPQLTASLALALPLSPAFCLSLPAWLQGEMVQAKFGVPSVALRQLEVFNNSVLLATLQVGGWVGGFVFYCQ
jgi:hypothetical protein